MIGTMNSFGGRQRGMEWQGETRWIEGSDGTDKGGARR